MLARGSNLRLAILISIKPTMPPKTPLNLTSTCSFLLPRNAPATAHLRWLRPYQYFEFGSIHSPFHPRFPMPHSDHKHHATVRQYAVAVVGGRTRMSVVDGKRQDGQSWIGSEHRTYGPTRVSTGVVHPLKLYEPLIFLFSDDGVASLVW
jgi:hypothetical protein